MNNGEDPDYKLDSVSLIVNNHETIDIKEDFQSFLESCEQLALNDKVDPQFAMDKIKNAKDHIIEIIREKPEFKKTYAADMHRLDQLWHMALERRDKAREIDRLDIDSNLNS